MNGISMKEKPKKKRPKLATQKRNITIGLELYEHEKLERVARDQRRKPGTMARMWIQDKLATFVNEWR